MNDYRQLYQLLSLPEAAIDVAFRNIALPFYTEDCFDTYGFVPALLPLWSGQGPSYTGYWKHWFGSRQMTLVEVTVENKRRTREVARIFDQLIYEVVLSAIEDAEKITSDIREFSGKVSLSPAELQQIDQIWQDGGSERAELLPLPVFASAPPLVCLPSGEGYTGDFPYDAMLLAEEKVRSMCSVETSRELHQRIAALPYAPPWFTVKEQAPVFNQLLSQGDYQGAWMSLNSTGWRFLEAKNALKRLAQAVNDPGLNLLATAWAAVPHEKNGITPETASY